MMGMYEPIRTGWPVTEPVNQASLIERIGWDVHLMVADGRFVVEREDDKPVGVRYELDDDWWVVVLNTPSGRYSIGRFRAMVPFGWLHGITVDALPEMVQRAAMCPITPRRLGGSEGHPGVAWPPTPEDL